jgi:hypothetical protein
LAERGAIELKVRTSELHVRAHRNPRVAAAGESGIDRGPRARPEVARDDASASSLIARIGEVAVPVDELALKDSVVGVEHDQLAWATVGGA